MADEPNDGEKVDDDAKASDDTASPAGDDAKAKASAAPKATVKARKKPRSTDDEEDDEPNAPAGPRGRLSFARSFPPSAELDALLDAFDRGNYARVRELAPPLVARADAPEIARAARDVARRVEPDRTVLALLGISIALLAVLAIWFWTHKLGAHP